MSMTPLRDCVIGIDVGTSGCKVAVVDTDGAIIGRGYVPYQPDHPAPGYVEQDPEVWWAAACEALAQAVAHDEVAGRVRGIGISSANALVLVDGDSRPLRPAIMQTDRRAVATAQRLREELNAAAVLESTGQPIMPGASWLPTLSWLQDYEPGAVANASTLLFPGGWVAYRLTGIAAVDFSRASTTLLLDARRRAWDRRFVRVAGLTERQLPLLTESASAIGSVLPDVAPELGLPSGIPVVAGAMDSALAALGAGGVAVGLASAALGTVGRVMVITDRYAPDACLMTCPYPVRPLWLSMGVVWGAGNALGWAARQWPDGTEDYERLAREAGRVPPGAEGLRFEVSPDVVTAPTTDELGGGILRGRSGQNTPAQIARAIVEGVLFALAEHAATVEERTGVRLKDVALVGGGARNPFMQQMLADVLGVDVRIPAVQETEPLGAAVLAAVGVGLFPDLAAAACAMVPDSHVSLSPDPQRHSAYIALRQGVGPRAMTEGTPIAVAPAATGVRAAV